MPDNNYQARTESNAAVTAAQVAAIVQAWRSGAIERPELPVWISTTIRAGASRAVMMADRQLSDVLGATIGRPVPTVGLVLPEGTAQEIVTGTRTAIEETDAPDEITTRADRLAKAAPLDAGQQAQMEAMRRQGVEGWTRTTDSSPCALCAALADGSVIPIRKTMIRHPGCSCVATPVLTGARARSHPDTGHEDPAEFVPTTLRTGHGIGGREFTRVRPGLTVRRDVFIPARARSRR